MDEMDKMDKLSAQQKALLAGTTITEILDANPGWVRPWSSRLYWDYDPAGGYRANDDLYRQKKALQRALND